MNLGGELAGNRNIDMRLLGKTNCPDEVELSAYLERSRATADRESMEEHLASCEKCRESVALMVYLQHRAVDPDSEVSRAEVAAATPVSLSGEELKTQTSAVMSLIAADEQKHRPVANWSGRKQRPVWYLLPAPMRALAAVLVVAFLSWGVYKGVTGWGESSADSAMKTLAEAMKPGRKTRSVLAEVQYAQPDPVTRSGARVPERTDDSSIYFDAALAKVRDASSTREKLVKARTLVATAERDKVAEGLTILQGLVAEGVKSAELFNDLGVAYHWERDYDRALEAFSEAMTRNPELIQAQFNRALVAKDKADVTAPPEERARLYSQARGDLEQFINKCPNSEWQNEAKQAQIEIDRVIDRRQ
jgi:tetratricopeptide (TPR) repeat protein